MEPSYSFILTRDPQAQGNQPTLAKSFDALKIKKFDLEFTVDPLFKKTSADFDEGGAQGLLMNHLSIDGKGRVVFDSGDVEVDEDEEEDAANEEMEAPEEMVDLDKLQGMLRGRYGYAMTDASLLQNHSLPLKISLRGPYR